jgi:AcrR family transcriptional regulator
MERIAGRAGVNEERLYNYFGCKDDLFALVLSLAAWWFAVPQVVRMLTGAPADAKAERTGRRAAVVEAARRLAAAAREAQWEPVTTSTRSPSGSSR